MTSEGLLLLLLQRLGHFVGATIPHNIDFISTTIHRARGMKLLLVGKLLIGHAIGLVGFPASNSANAPIRRRR